MQDATENCPCPKIFGEPLSPELKCTFLLEHVTAYIVLGERMSSVTVDNCGVFGKSM